MNYVIGLSISLVVAFLSKLAGDAFRTRTGIVLREGVALAVGVAVALAVWFSLRMLSSLPREIIDGIGLGPAIGLTTSLRKPRA